MAIKARLPDPEIIEGDEEQVAPPVQHNMNDNGLATRAAIIRKNY